MKIKKGVAYRVIVGTTYIVQPETSYLHELNDTAGFIWKQIEKGKNTDEIAEALVNRYDVAPEVAKNDLQIFLQELEEKQLIEDIR